MVEMVVVQRTFTLTLNYDPPPHVTTLKCGIFHLKFAFTVAYISFSTFVFTK